ncbi:hypothetical protein ATANTOWER_016710 [Ataeniobius toweri]|uniref:Uncharacterized protein n=1 Tax=Ataeniobius toweri TaxID=208326 RepID=A0ABU7A759_9TELE|nr:hypothetical protein [Ataeniobius toweri]
MIQPSSAEKMSGQINTPAVRSGGCLIHLAHTCQGFCADQGLTWMFRLGRGHVNGVGFVFINDIDPH